MGLLDKAKAAAEQAAAKAKDTAQDLQARKDIFQAYNELGQTTFELVDSGEVTHPKLSEQVDRIRGLKAETESNGSAPSQSAAETVTTPPSDQPPAMPT